jgi:hypothetical protein
MEQRDNYSISTGSVGGQTETIATAIIGVDEGGTHTSEFWMAAITSVVVALLALLVGYGVLTSEMAELWKAVVLAVAGIVVPIVLGQVAKSYVASRTAVKMSLLDLERERLRSVK